MVRRLTLAAIALVTALAAGVAEPPSGLPDSKPAPAPGSVAAPKDPLDDVRRGWEKRDARFAKVVVTWEERRVHKRGGVSLAFPELVPPGAVLPPADATHTSPFELVLDGKRVRLRGMPTAWDLDDNAFETAVCEGAYDGARTTTVRAGTADLSLAPVATVRPGLVPHFYAADARPVLWALRPGSPDLLPDFTAERFAASGEPEVVAGRPCTVLTAGGPGADPLARLWVDAGRGGLVRKVELYAGKALSSRTVIRYHEAGPDAGLPSGWRAEAFAAGRLFRQTEGEVKVIARNPELPAGAFDLRLAPGTVVFREGADGRSVREVVPDPVPAKRLPGKP